MSPEPFQLSHEELLVVLGLLQLPPPLALGPRPVAGYTSSSLAIALGGAVGSLAARELLHFAGDPTVPPAPIAPLATLVRAVALADSHLIVAERRPCARQVTHLTAQATTLVLHTSPHPRVHRLAPLADAAAVTGWLAVEIGAKSLTGPITLRAPAAALRAALDAAETGHVDKATNHLMSAGVAPGTATTFVAALGTSPTRFVLGALRHARAPQPEALGALAVCGTAATWWCRTDTRADALTLHPVGAAELRHELDALASWVMQPA